MVLLFESISKFFYISLCHFLYRSVGFSGTPSESVCYALVYMSRLVTRETTALTNGMSPSACQVIHPRQGLPDVLELLHHVNQVSPVFFVEGIIGRWQIQPIVMRGDSLLRWYL